MSGSRRGNTSNPLFRNRNNAFAPIAQVVPLLSSTYRIVDLQLVVVQLFLIRWRKIRKRSEVEGRSSKNGMRIAWIFPICGWKLSFVICFFRSDYFYAIFKIPSRWKIIRRKRIIDKNWLSSCRIDPGVLYRECVRIYDEYITPIYFFLHLIKSDILQKSSWRNICLS